MCWYVIKTPAFLSGHFAVVHLDEGKGRVRERMLFGVAAPPAADVHYM